jgi:hypothetical protein
LETPCSTAGQPEDYAVQRRHLEINPSELGC